MTQSIALTTAVRLDPAPIRRWFVRLSRTLVDLTAGAPTAGSELDAFMPPSWATYRSSAGLGSTGAFEPR